MSFVMHLLVEVKGDLNSIYMAYLHLNKKKKPFLNSYSPKRCFIFQKTIAIIHIINIKDNILSFSSAAVIQKSLPCVIFRQESS